VPITKLAIEIASAEIALLKVPQGRAGIHVVNQTLGGDAAGAVHPATAAGVRAARPVAPLADHAVVGSPVAVGVTLLALGPLGLFDVRVRTMRVATVSLEGEVGFRGGPDHVRIVHAARVLGAIVRQLLLGAKAGAVGGAVIGGLLPGSGVDALDVVDVHGLAPNVVVLAILSVAQAVLLDLRVAAAAHLVLSGVILRNGIALAYVRTAAHSHVTGRRRNDRGRA
jgi:hypothetical protein